MTKRQRSIAEEDFPLFSPHTAEKTKAAQQRIKELELLITKWQEKESLSSECDPQTMSPPKHSNQNNDSTTV